MFRFEQPRRKLVAPSYPRTSRHPDRPFLPGAVKLGAASQLPPGQGATYPYPGDGNPGIVVRQANGVMVAQSVPTLAAQWGIRKARLSVPAPERFTTPRTAPSSAASPRAAGAPESDRTSRRDPCHKDLTAQRVAQKRGFRTRLVKDALRSGSEQLERS